MTLCENAGLVLVSRAGCRVVGPCKHQWKRAELFPDTACAGAGRVSSKGETAVWEMRLDDVVTGRVHFKGVIDEIAAETGKLIDVLRGHTGALVDLSRPAPSAARRGRGRARNKRNADKEPTDTSGSTRLKAKSRQARKTTKAATPNGGAQTHATAARSAPPTDKMMAFAEKLAKEKRVELPAGYAKNFEICRRFLDDYAGRRGARK